MRELSLFTGAGGGIYGSKILGWSTIGYVEWEEYPQKVIAQRIKDGIFDEAPIFGDIRTFVSEGYARKYRGMVDVVTGGFPCQPFSVAGKRKASDDDRNMWPATMGVIKAVKPPVVYLENVPGLLSATVDDESGRPIHYFGTVLRDLAESGYDVKWCVLGADDVGAPHHRKRLWILGVHADTKYDGFLALQKSRSQRAPVFNNKKRAHSASQFKRMDSSRNVANTKCTRLERNEQEPSTSRHIGLRHRTGQNEDQSVFEYKPNELSWWGTEPLLGRMANGVANRSHRLKAIGNGQVSLTMACAYGILSREFLR